MLTMSELLVYNYLSWLLSLLARLTTIGNSRKKLPRATHMFSRREQSVQILKTLRIEIDKQAWDSLNSAVSRPFPKPDSGCIAVKVINHLGDEVMKVFDV